MGLWTQFPLLVCKILHQKSSLHNSGLLFWMQFLTPFSVDKMPTNEILIPFTLLLGTESFAITSHKRHLNRGMDSKMVKNSIVTSAIPWGIPVWIYSMHSYTLTAKGNEYYEINLCLSNWNFPVVTSPDFTMLQLTMVIHRVSQTSFH